MRIPRDQKLTWWPLLGAFICFGLPLIWVVIKLIWRK